MSAAEELKGLVQKAKAYVDAERRQQPQAKVLTREPLTHAVSAPQAGPVAAAAAFAKAGPNPKAPWARGLAEFEAQICACQRCPLGAIRKKFVFGSGNAKAKLVFFAEAPGADEEASGQPLDGEAGKLLNKIIGAMGFKREDVYLMNALKCRPPKDRAAEAVELEACKPYYLQQLDLIRPKAICSLGAPATHALLGPQVDFSKARGNFFELGGILVMPTLHPSELLKNEGLKRQVWEDMKGLLKKIS